MARAVGGFAPGFGAFTFSVGHPSTATSGSQAVATLHCIFRVLGYAAFAGLAGSLSVRFLGWPTGSTGKLKATTLPADVLHLDAMASWVGGLITILVANPRLKAIAKFGGWPSPASVCCHSPAGGG